MSKDIIFIKISDPSIEDVKYTSQLVDNWHNYYMPEQYLLDNMKLINIPNYNPGMPVDLPDRPGILVLPASGTVKPE